jgi:hypothetical protein
VPPLSPPKKFAVKLAQTLFSKTFTPTCRSGISSAACDQDGSIQKPKRAVFVGMSRAQMNARADTIGSNDSNHEENVVQSARLRTGATLQ